MSKAKTLFLVVLCISLLTSCKTTSDLETPATLAQPPTAQNSAFNTLPDNSEWGDEADFFRIAEFKPDFPLDYVFEELTSADFRLKPDTDYVLAAYFHNTSTQTQKAANLVLSYSPILQYDLDNSISVSFEYGDPPQRPLQTQLNLSCSCDLKISLTKDIDGNCYMLRSDNTEFVSGIPDTSVITDNIMTHLIEFDSIPADASRLLLFFIHTKRSA